MPRKRPTTLAEWEAKRAADRARYRMNPAIAHAASKKWKLKNLDRVNMLRRMKREAKRKLLPKKIKKTPEEHKQKRAEWRARNKRQRALWERNRKQRNQEAFLMARRKYHASNREAVNRQAREWKKQNPHKTSAYNGRRRSLKKARLHPLASSALMSAVYVASRALGMASGRRHHVDHIIPLIHGGWHHEDNLQPMPKAMNETKHDNPFWLSPSLEYKDWRDVPRELWPLDLLPKYLELIAQHQGVSIRWDTAA